MRNLSLILIALSALGFVLAVVKVLLGMPILGITAEGFSSGATNLALLAIALMMLEKGGPSAGS